MVRVTKIVKRPETEGHVRTGGKWQDCHGEKAKEDRAPQKQKRRPGGALRFGNAFYITRTSL
jgi:hypothetical protein